MLRIKPRSESCPIRASIPFGQCRPALSKTPHRSLRRALGAYIGARRAAGICSQRPMAWSRCHKFAAQNADVYHCASPYKGCASPRTHPVPSLRYGLRLPFAPLSGRRYVVLDGQAANSRQRWQTEPGVELRIPQNLRSGSESSAPVALGNHF